MREHYRPQCLVPSQFFVFISLRILNHSNTYLPFVILLDARALRDFRLVLVKSQTYSFGFSLYALVRAWAVLKSRSVSYNFVLPGITSYLQKLI
jgi:hypothetical protein